jgi:hypothetical protein
LKGSGQAYPIEHYLVHFMVPHLFSAVAAGFYQTWRQASGVSPEMNAYTPLLLAGYGERWAQ